MRVIRPSSSYQITLPDNVVEKIEPRVASFWLPSGPMLLQISSYLRAAGEQVEAKDRLHDRMARSPTMWFVWPEGLHEDEGVSQAIGQTMDERGLTWIHAYLCWPHLTVYATISGPESSMQDKDGWAFRGVKSVLLNLQ